MRDTITMTAAVSFLILMSASGAFAQVQSAAQQKCLNAVNKDGAAVARTQGKENVACLKGAGTQVCLTADAKSKVSKAKNKTTADASKSCGPPTPSFGYTSAAIINGAAAQGEVDLTADVFGPDLGSAVITCTSDKAGCACQQKILKTVEQLASVKLAAFVKCKKAVLAGGATSAESLRKCVSDDGTPGSIAADATGKIGKTVGALNAAITKNCNPAGSAFPGTCNSLTGSTLGVCLDRQVECRVCQIINEMDGIFVNCDLFDNGVADASCASGTGPCVNHDVDNGDGTVTEDSCTHLMWEKKTTAVGSGVNLTDPHDADNVYRWCLDANLDANCDTPGYPPDGTAFADFLVKLNTTPCFAGHCDWRLPTLVELQTILLPSCPGYPNPCIDAVFGPTVPAAYWTSTNDSNPAYAWTVYFGPGTAFPDSKTYWGDGTYVRAVRTGP